MSTELTRPVQLVNPTSGEALTLDSPTEDLAAFMAAMTEFQALVREQKREVTQEILRRFDHACRWTQTVGGLKVSAPSPAPVEEWEGAELRTALLELVDEGLLAIEAVDAAVETVITYKPRKAGLNALRKVGGRVAEVVDSLARQVEKDRYLKVTAP